MGGRGRDEANVRSDGGVGPVFFSPFGKRGKNEGKREGFKDEQKYKKDIKKTKDEIKSTENQIDEMQTLKLK